MKTQEDSALRSFMRRFARASLIAPVDSLGLPLTEVISGMVAAHLAADAKGEDAHEKRMNWHFRDVLGTYGRAPEEGAQGKPFPYAGNGTAIIPVHGVLLNRWNYAAPYATGYNAIRSMLNAALADADVQRIVLDINSPGGQAAGAFELAEDIRAARDVKPIRAIADSYAFSAAYAVASAASDIVVTPSGEVGSIGVVSAHMNIGPALKEFGIEITFIYAGKHKVDGNPYEALSDDVKAGIQADVDRIYGVFTASVAAGRKRKMTEADARKTEAHCYGADDAVAIGLADHIMPASAALASFETTSTTGAPASNVIASKEKEGTTMTDENKAREEDRARISAILDHDEAKGRESLARHLALKTDMSVEIAVEALKAAPKATAASAVSALDRAMDRIEHPEVGADAGQGDKKADDDSPKARADRIWSSFQAAGGAALAVPSKASKAH
jgi:signal peptide peptidase SppA